MRCRKAQKSAVIGSGNEYNYIEDTIDTGNISQWRSVSRTVKRKEKNKMTNCLITFRSATYSMKAQLALSRAGIAARAVKLDAEYSGRGCTHGLRIDCRVKRNAERILREGGIPFSAVVGS